MKNKILSFAVLIFATATSFAQNSAIYKAEELMNDEELIKRAKMQEKIQNIIKDKKILKEICVTNKLVNLVVR